MTVQIVDIADIVKGLRGAERNIQLIVKDVQEKFDIVIFRGYEYLFSQQHFTVAQRHTAGQVVAGLGEAFFQLLRLHRSEVFQIVLNLAEIGEQCKHFILLNLIHALPFSAVNAHFIQRRLSLCLRGKADLFGLLDYVKALVFHQCQLMIDATQATMNNGVLFTQALIVIRQHVVGIGFGVQRAVKLSHQQRQIGLCAVQESLK